MYGSADGWNVENGSILIGSNVRNDFRKNDETWVSLFTPETKPRVYNAKNPSDRVSNVDFCTLTSNVVD